MKAVTSEGLRVHRVSRVAQNAASSAPVNSAGPLVPGMELVALCGLEWTASVTDSETLETLPDCKDCLLVEYLTLGHDITYFNETIEKMQEAIVNAIGRRDYIVNQLHPVTATGQLHPTESGGTK